MVPKRSKLLKLNPILIDGVLRVGGRLTHSLLIPDKKHPLILPQDCQLTTLLIEQVHRQTLHGGIQLTLNTLRQGYWILRGRQAVKAVIHRCIPCLRYRSTAAYQRMGDLPEMRVRPSRPFQHSGVDYAGPFLIRAAAGRWRTSFKGYVAVFICLSTRAVHLEAVSSYTTEAFLAAFRRFTSRRGHCSSLRSDRGTNFVGADAELRRLYHEASTHSQAIGALLAEEGTIWTYNPPAAPHFGGIWEAAVKSMKHHLRRVVGEHKLTFEEFTTLLCQIEACLNSRPLVPLSADPNDLLALTPAHFLIGSPAYIVPGPQLKEEKISPSNRWKLLQQMTEHLWARWSSEYLNTLQARSKWKTSSRSLQPGDLVLIRNELTSPARWPLGRIHETYPGEDGLVRVVSIKTATSIFKRPIVKVVPLFSPEQVDD